MKNIMNVIVANWKMNLTLEQANKLVDVLTQNISTLNSQVILSVPFVYLSLVKEKIKNKKGFYLSAQNCYHKKSGAYTGEISAEMLSSLAIDYVIIGHSERREYFNESNKILEEKIIIALEHNLKVIFCCGESLDIRDQGKHIEFIQNQLVESLFNLSEAQMKNIIVAYEPIWAIGTGKTATRQQAQDMQQMIREFLKIKFPTLASTIPILYGGSVKANNAKELFACPDINGALVGGASLIDTEFISIVHSA